MIKFIDGLNPERQESLLSTREVVEKLLLDRTKYADNIDLMMSEQPADVDLAMENIYEGIFHNGIEKYQKDIDFLIDRAIMKIPVALTAIGLSTYTGKSPCPLTRPLSFISRMKYSIS